MKSTYLSKGSAILSVGHKQILKFVSLLVMATITRLAVQEIMRVYVLNEEGYSLHSNAKRLGIGKRTVQLNR